MSFKDLSLEQLINDIKIAKVSRKEVFDYFQNRIEKYDDKIKSYNYVNKEGLNT